MFVTLPNQCRSAIAQESVFTNMCTVPCLKPTVVSIRSGAGVFIIASASMASVNCFTGIPFFTQNPRWKKDRQ